MRRTSGPATGMPVDRLSLLGGRLCLDFVNTLDPRWGEENTDFLDSYAALVAWAVHANALTLDQRQALGREAAARPAEAAATLAAAVALREALFRLFGALGEGDEPAAADLGALNGALAAAMAHANVEPNGDRFAWGWREDECALDRPLWPVVRSAAELLTGPDLGRLRACPADRCDWLFVDDTKNRSRRWCSMKDCGSQDKARTYYQRRRAARSLGRVD